jgi:hypothetical protein
VIAAATLFAGFSNHAFTGFPKGYDAYGHMSKIKLLVDYFPNTDWNYQWYSGEDQPSCRRYEKPCVQRSDAGLLLAQRETRHSSRRDPAE